MTITYKTDNSFFTHIPIPMSWYGVWEVRYWFQTLGGYAAKYRMIADEELDDDRRDLKYRDESSESLSKSLNEAMVVSVPLATSMALTVAVVFV
jgi:hypothetical protein